MNTFIYIEIENDVNCLKYISAEFMVEFLK